VINDATGGYAIGFVLLGLFAILCFLVNYTVFIRNSGKRGTLRAVAAES